MVRPGIRGGMIYFIQSTGDGLVKIGMTRDLAGRLRTLQTGHPHHLQIIGFMPGGRLEERHLHELLAEHRVRGEWFRPAREVLEVAWYGGEIPPHPTPAASEPIVLRCIIGASDRDRSTSEH